MSATAIDPLIPLAAEWLGIACLSPFAVQDEIAHSRFVSLFEDHVVEADQFSVLWPTASSRRRSAPSSTLWLRIYFQIVPERS